MRNPRDFFRPLAIGAPEPLREIPFKPSRMIHFLDLSNEKMVAKAPDIAPQVDILLGNLEDAVPVDRKLAAREGLIRVGREMDLGDTALWTRVNALESPWVLDDLTEIVREIGDLEGCETQFRAAFLLGCVGAWSLHPAQIDIAKKVFSPDPDEVRFAKKVIEAIPDGRGVH